MYLFIAILAINIGYSINYSIPDVESYFIPSIVVIGILLALGIQRFKRRYLALLAIIPIFHLHEVTGRGYHFASDLARNILTNMDKRALLICNVWDCYSPLLYYDVVEGKGQDHWIIDKELLRRSWYLRYLKKRYPELYQRCQPQFSRFEEQLYLFEHDLPYNKQLIQARFEELIRQLFLAGMADRKTYLLSPIPDHDLERALTNIKKRPEGLLMRIGAEADTIDFSHLEIRLPSRIDPRHRFLISSIYAKAAYLNYQYYRSESALDLYQKLTRKLR